MRVETKRKTRAMPRRKAQQEDEEQEPAISWIGKQKPTTQLTLFDTTFQRKHPVSPDADGSDDAEDAHQVLAGRQATLDKWLFHA